MKGGDVKIPSSYTVKVGGTGSTILVDADLDNIHTYVEKIPRIELSLEKIPKVETESGIRIRELPQINLAVEKIPPITTNLNLAIKEVPEQRYHMPAYYHVGFSLFGLEVFRLSLCGESQVINEKYVPRRMELGCE